MKAKFITLVPFALLTLFAAAGCASGAKPLDANAQSIVDATMKKHPEIVRLTVHTSVDGKPHAVASSAADKLNKPSDKEDIDAMTTGKPVVLDEPGALDVTVPAMQKDGKFTHAIGVTLKADEKADKKALEAKATEIANAVAKDLAAKK